jgi:poly-gamma-glutamate capsule biosynthesis protein CapA/YwtB (metallophosphatase superfamily)
MRLTVLGLWAACCCALVGFSACGAQTSVGTTDQAKTNAVARGQRPIVLEWVGDIALSTDLGLPRGGLTGALKPVAGLLRHADLTLGNLEGTLSTSGSSKCGATTATDCFAFRAPPSYAGQLRSLGFDVLNQANNHALDDGPEGQRQTIAALNHAGVAHDGLPGEITLRRVAGRSVAIVGFAPYRYASNLLDIKSAAALVRHARRLASLVVVIIHAGAEGVGETHTPRGPEFFLGEDRGDARAFSHAMIDAGAGIVLGSGPHVIRGVEHYRNRLIAYSLGNFVGYRTLGEGGALSQSGILRLRLSASGLVLGGRWISINLIGGLPRRDPANVSAHVVERLSREDFGHDRFAMDASGLIMAPR